MSVKIIFDDKIVDYDIYRTLEDQIQGYSKIIIDYEDQDMTMNSFLDRVEKMCESGSSKILNIQVIHNDHIGGAKAKKRMKQSSKNMEINKLIKLLSLSYSEADKKLEELSEKCYGKVCKSK